MPAHLDRVRASIYKNRWVDLRNLDNMKSIDYRTASFLDNPHALEIFNKDYLPPDLKLLLKLQEYVERDFRRHKAPQYYADELKRSLKSLNKLSLYYLEKTVYVLIQERVHTEVMCLLRNTTLSAKQISYEIGVANPSYFSRYFKIKTGKSPQAWRREQQALKRT